MSMCPLHVVFQTNSWLLLRNNHVIKVKNVYTFMVAIQDGSFISEIFFIFTKIFYTFWLFCSWLMTILGSCRDDKIYLSIYIIPSVYLIPAKNAEVNVLLQGSSVKTKKGNGYCFLCRHNDHHHEHRDRPWKISLLYTL